jgi:hypothetical protein
MTSDELRTAHLLFGPEIAAGTIGFRDVAKREVADAATVRRIPSRPTRALQRRLVDRGRLSATSEVLPALAAARRAVLGDRAAGPPRVLLRAPADPELHAALTRHGVPYCAEIDPRDPDAEELAALVRADGALPALVGPDPAQDPPALHARVAVAPAAGLAMRDLGPLAERFEVVCCGPESLASIGFHLTPQVRGGSVLLPAHPPFCGGAGDLAAALAPVLGERSGVWLPVALTGRDGAGLPDLAALLAGGVAVDWDLLLDALAAALRATA